MRGTERVAVIYSPTDEKQFIIKYDKEATAEDLCNQVCKIFEIGPIARCLFAIRYHSSKLWLPYGLKLEDTESSERTYDFRVRFKPSSMQRLKRIDEKAYNYYFQQARNDIMENNVPDIVYEKHKRELIGLGVSDMYRVMIEKRIPRETVESDYKKYIPKECIKRHAFFIKKPIHNALDKIFNIQDPSYVKEEYLKQFESMAPNYPYEEYKAQINTRVPNSQAKILLRIKSEEVKYCELATNTWHTLCAIEDLCFISIGKDNTVEVSRKSGIPSYLQFKTTELLMSFVSALDGYYRLSVKWTFNLCRNVITPSLERLHKLRCHGPVGEEFSHAKLKEKRANKAGTYLLRQSETEYNIYYIDVCIADGKIFTQKVHEDTPNVFKVPDSNTVAKTLVQIVSQLQELKKLETIECLPPSEYDASPLLICASVIINNEISADEEIIKNLLEGELRCVSWNQLHIYRELAKNNEKHAHMSATSLQHGKWRVADNKKFDIAIKVLKNNQNDYTKDFLELADKWGRLRSGALVRLYGITVAPTIGMLLELVPLGPLDKYLCDRFQTVKTADLVEATTYLAAALWHLEENHVIHGNIRCKKLLVHAHTTNTFIIKLSDPGIFTYTDVDLPWIPPECYSDLESAKCSFQADTWSMATTIWEIFSRGISIPVYHDSNSVKQFYSSGYRLPRPNGCPEEVYKLMQECWGENNASRKQPQAIMRDINQILYQVYSSRRNHSYATAFPKLFNDETDNEDRESNSDASESKSVSDESHVSSNDNEIEKSSSSATKLLEPLDNDNNKEELLSYLNLLLRAMRGSYNMQSNERSFRANRELLSDITRFKNENNNNSVDGNSASSMNQTQRSAYELEGYNIILQGRIGNGYYGEVYRGLLERDDIEITVAVKKLKKRFVETSVGLCDFEREISIMKQLKHPNIVQILGVWSDPDPCLVMEYVNCGSLHNYITKPETKAYLTPAKLLSFALDISTGMEYLGRMNIVHRDLAARNVLLEDANRAKISDFGLAQVMGNNDYYILQTNRDLPIKWYAPESLRDGKFSTRSDVWSYGVTLYEMFSIGQDPQLPGIDWSRKSEGSATDLLNALEQGNHLPCPPSCPQRIYTKLMYPCWHLVSHERPTFSLLCTDIQEMLNEY